MTLSPNLRTSTRAALPVLAVLLAGLGCAHQRAAEPAQVEAALDRDQLDRDRHAAAPQAIAEVAPAQRTFLWKISGNGTNGWLLGSIHMAPPSLYPLPAVIDDAWSDSDELVVEADILNTEGMELQQAMLHAALFTDGRTLSQVLPKETWEATAKQLTQHGIDPRMMQPFRPWFVALTLSSQALIAAGSSPEHGMDLHFLKRAMEAHRPIVELEGAAFQIELLSSFSDREQELFLSSTLLSLHQLDADMKSMLRTWKTGDVAEMERQLTRSVVTEDDRALYAKFMTDRNAAMTDGIEKRLRTGRTTFVVVGAGHLVGDDGVVEQLRARGYSVEQQ